MRPQSAGIIDFRAGSKDRFEQPKASIAYSPNGLKCYGLSPRPACRVLRYDAEQACAAASAAAEERVMGRPSGRRHDAFLAYLDAVRNNEERWGLETMQARSGRRCTAAVYKAVHGGSQGVATCLEWSGHLGGGSELPPRPSTAPPSGSGSSSPSRFLDFYSPAHGASSPRFKARAEFERRRCATPDPEATKRSSYLEQHKQRKAAAAVKEAQEGALIEAWPHGCPVAVLRDARLAGLHPPALPRGTYDRPRISRSPPGTC